jgi:xylulose-5-phosphate/fructose-6-phosphate phosphoketolase
VPLSGVRENQDHLRLLEEWMRSYRPEELFDADGAPVELVRNASPPDPLRMSASPHTNGGLVSRPLDLPDFWGFGLAVDSPGAERAESTRQLGTMLAEIYRRNPDRFRLFSPDETNSNRLGAVFNVSDRAFMERIEPGDVQISHVGRVMEVLSEHNCHGWLEGYTLTGRHGIFATYEAFAMVSASQTVQHSKWLEGAARLPWRARIPSFNVLLTSTAWRNEHNGFSHQGPGLIQIMLTHRGEVARIYLPPDANCLLSVVNHCLRSTSYVNLIVIDKQPQLQWLTMDEAVEHCARGASVWKWAGNDDPGQEPDVVLACAGDIVTMEVVAAAQILRERLPQLRTRVVNVVDLMKLIRPKDHPHGMGEMQFAELFTQSVDVVFAFHGFPGGIHQVLHGRPDADRFHVRGYIEEGTTTTPFDMTALNRVTRYHLVIDAITNARRIPAGAGQLLAWCEEKLREHDRYVVEHLEDLPEIRNWQLPTR